MGWIRNLRDQASDFWGQTSTPAKAGIIATAVLCVAVFVGVGFWSSRPQYVPLASNLGPAEAAEIISKLNAEGIPNEQNHAGSTVLVPKPQWSNARLVLGDLIGPAAPGLDDFGNDLLSDPDLNHFKMLRHQEANLARTIEQMRAVDKATVHISQAETTPFIRDQQPTTASAVLQLRRGAAFSHEQAAAVVAMLANSVEGLEPDQVTVMDTDGRVFSSQYSGSDAAIATQYEYRQRLQADLASKAELMLDRLLGRGRSVVRVTADVDFTQTQREETTYDPDAKVKKSERIRTSERTGGNSSAEGAAGTASNVGISPITRGSTPISEKEEENETEYENAMTKDTITEAAGTIKRLTVAAIVQLPEGEQGAAPPLTKEQVEGILKQAVGFDEQRDDMIEVLVGELAGDTVGQPTGLAPFGWDQINRLVRNASLGLAAIVALVVGLMIVRKLKPVEVSSRPSGMLTMEQAQRIADLSSQAAAKPDVIGKVVRAWLGEPVHVDETVSSDDEEKGPGTGRMAA